MASGRDIRLQNLVSPIRRRGKSPSPLQLAAIPIVFRPLVRAYILGYASAVAPRLLTLVLQHVSKRRRRKWQRVEQDEHSFLESVDKILRTGLELHRFPTFCAVLVGGSSLLLQPVQRLINYLLISFGPAFRLRIARWLSTFLAAWASIRMLQSQPKVLQPEDDGHDGASQQTHVNGNLTMKTPRKVAGRTLDLTLFAITRALDVLVGELWSQHRARRQSAKRWTKLEQFMTSMVDPMVFTASCGLIMWSWFYTPERLPRGYNKWITSAANVDLRLIEALRRCRKGELRYTEETGQAPLLGSMCTDFKLPYEWGDPAKAVPFPCELVHMGCGPSCEYHALSRFCRSWRWSMFTYLPLALALQLRKPNRKSLIRAFLSASRSSAFLGMFITLFYYGVCLGRTRVGPHLVGKDVPCRQRIDGGLCVGVGCALCGWSVLIETASRRKDMALFVAPRALATVVPRYYPLERQWRETTVFAMSTAVVFTCVLENPKRVRGVLGGVLSMVMRD